MRGQAKAYTAVGAVAAGAWAVAESGLLMDALLFAEPKTKAGKTLLFATSAVALGAMIAAVVKHSHADKIEASRSHHEGLQR